jgi:hypothetical protein
MGMFIYISSSVGTSVKKSQAHISHYPYPDYSCSLQWQAPVFYITGSKQHSMGGCVQEWYFLSSHY